MKLNDNVTGIFDQAPSPIALLMGPMHEFTLANPAYIHLIGQNPIGKSVRSVFSEDEAGEFFGLLDSVYTTGEPFKGKELPFKKKIAPGKHEDLRLDISYSAFRDKDDQIVGILAFVYDVTEAFRARKLIEASHLQYSSLADSMPQSVWTADSVGQLDYFNKIWIEYSGTSFEDNVGSGWSNAVHPEDLASSVARWQLALESGSIYETEFRLRAADGSYRWHVARALPAKNENGEITKWYGTNTDIHRVKLLTEELQLARQSVESEQQKFKTIFSDSSTSMAVLKGPEFVYEIANQSYLELFNNRSLIGKPFLVALPELIGQEFPKIAKRVFETGVAYQVKEDLAFLRRTDSSGLEERYFDQTYTRMLDEVGQPYGVFIHAIEVTERVFAQRQIREASERFRMAVETANMGTWEIEPTSQVAKWSDRTKEIYGVAQDTQLPLNDVIKRAHPEDRERVETAVAQATEPSGSGAYDVQHRIVRDDGEVRWVSFAGKAFFVESPTGKSLQRFVGTALDVTDRILSEEALRNAKERAEAANAAKSSFLANMSHEIRTPLGAIMGFVSLIKDEGVNDKRIQNYASVIERNSVQLLRIIDDILDLSKVEAGMMMIEHINFSLVELLSDFASLMGFRAREKGVSFSIAALTELPDVIDSDPTRLRQILTNIVGNAIKFTEHGEVQLRVSYSRHRLEFEVEDSGKGITTEQSAQLFQPFAQGDVSTTRKFGGTGLGLVLTRKLCEALGGVFELKSSQPGKGSIFYASVEVRVANEMRFVNALGFASDVVRNAGVRPVLQNARILLVEDSPDNQELFAIYLSRAGAKVDIASDGKKGVEMALAEAYDIVLMDVQMPVMDGIAAVKELRALKYSGPIIALTAHAMKEERARCVAAGYTNFLSKPLKREDLIEHIRKYLKT